MKKKTDGGQIDMPLWDANVREDALEIDTDRTDLAPSRKGMPTKRKSVAARQAVLESINEAFGKICLGGQLEMNLSSDD